MSYREEMQKYLNPETGLCGITPNEANYSTGNPLTETGTAYVLLRANSLVNALDALKLISTFNNCKESPLDALFSKKPGVDDRLSHDDVIGIVAGYAAVGRAEFAGVVNIIDYGRKHLWIFSNTGKFYFDALTKPWHKGFYLMACDQPTSIANVAFFAGAILADALTNKDNASDKRLTWLMVKSVVGKSKLIDFISKIWWARLNSSVFGSMKGVFKAYHGEDHVFTRYCNE